jgi:ribonuclease HII
MNCNSAEWIPVCIIEDDNDESVQTDEINKDDKKEEIIKLNVIKNKNIIDNKNSKSVLTKKTVKEPLKFSYLKDIQILEIGVDEAGRGPLFGPVYVAATVLPKDDKTFLHSKMKDSKKFHSKKKIEETAEYIKNNCIAWAVEYEDERVIDEINILQATQQAMHKAIQNVINQLSTISEYRENIKQNKLLLLIDGNYFKPMYTKDGAKLNTILVEKGDNTYTSIAAASILAKSSRDLYITTLCEENPELGDLYGINGNMGYGAAKHIEGIKMHGITKWHRRSFGICKNYV